MQFGFACVVLLNNKKRPPADRETFVCLTLGI
jgi:hypothetical protein